jgi:hypothetical protein
MYEKPEAETSKENKSLFVEVNICDQNVMIRKQTAVWLFQETERVSSDRLFRVRSKQPHSGSDKTVTSSISMTEDENPVKADNITIGDLCVFKAGHSQATIGKVLQIVLIERGKQKPFKGNYILLSSGNYEVLCTWYIGKGDHYKVCEKADFNYYHINNYVCTITKGCLVIHQSVNPPLGFQSSILDVDDTFTLTKSCSDYIKHLITIASEEASLAY